jgi:hypothetical protein
VVGRALAWSAPPSRRRVAAVWPRSVFRRRPQAAAPAEPDRTEVGV